MPSHIMRHDGVPRQARKSASSRSHRSSSSQYSSAAAVPVLSYSATLAALTEAETNGELLDDFQGRHLKPAQSPLTPGSLFTRPHPGPQPQYTRPSDSTTAANDEYYYFSSTHSSQGFPSTPLSLGPNDTMTVEDEEASWTLLMMSRGVKAGWNTRLPPVQPPYADTRQGNISYADVYESLSRSGSLEINEQPHDKSWKATLEREAHGHN
ncbi:hypothetical protein AAP_03697 [Ascosphaera apis ARSEF 7405]|uniref:Uncharacterized protein n=1 Tax=Ascosphaera apis ARSEF 7405 TaxID=392613 RepID=A0A167XXP5_9EURO|nr:hypothetical protein AAP_03697 [Ascosphaera apis ARSEF 7405]